MYFFRSVVLYPISNVGFKTYLSMILVPEIKMYVILFPVCSFLIFVF